MNVSKIRSAVGALLALRVKERKEIRERDRIREENVVSAERPKLHSL